jgi:hypothetical protein
MARKKVDPAAAKAAKQKKMAIGLSCLLLAAMAFSIPLSIKKMKELNGAPPATAAPAAPVPSGTPAPAPVVPGTDVAAAGAEQLASAGAEPALSEAPPLEAGEGQLIAFDRFVSKDPFVQQVGEGADAVGADTGAAAPTPTGTPGGIQPGGATGVVGPLPPTSSTPPATGGTSGSGSGATGATGATGFDPQTAPAAPPAALPTTATISVNGGTAEAVVAAGTFPSVQPIFTLVSLTRTGVKIGIVDGNYESGDPTVELTVGKPVTLMNTSDGQRYEILLVSLA